MKIIQIDKTSNKPKTWKSTDERVFAKITKKTSFVNLHST